ncbi:MAG: sigma-54-dependent Fis family transcriptional regulator [Planctomycetes bacterium]|nr:sigma-54-dependent Fis family transcriptional regulator [Planctomycetota bacterium]
MARILVVDDKLNVLKLFVRMLQKEHTVETASTAESALEQLAGEEFDLVVTDVRMPGMDGLALLERVRRFGPDTEVVVMTAYATVEQAVQAMKAGAFHYVTKPFQAEALLLVVERALERRRLRRTNLALRRTLGGSIGERPILGKSSAIRGVLELLDRVKATDTRVLVTGETGTGKELVARAVHEGSPRREAAFIPVHCGAIPRDLLESELFGYVQGAFSGAIRSSEGLLGAAQGGTLFLDEVSELQPDLQVKLNRLLQEGEARPVGGSAPHQVDVRFVAASNRDLAEDVRRGRFREDLYFRLNVFPIRVPALRERPEDIPVLAEHFLRFYANRLGKPVLLMEPGALALLQGYAWPGNVRELEHLVERAVLLADGDILDQAAFPDLSAATPRAEQARDANASSGPLSYKGYMNQTARASARRYLVELLRRTAGNVTEAAREAGIERESFHRMLRRHDLGAKEYRSG